MNKPHHIQQSVWPIYLSIAAALFICLFPFSGWLEQFMPNLVLLVVFYWALYRPDTIGMGIAWLIGLTQDLLMANLIGQHALVYVIVVFFINYSSVGNKNNSFFDYMILLVAFVLLDIILVLFINYIVLQITPHWSILYSLLGSILIWPWLYAILNIFEAIAAQVHT